MEPYLGMIFAFAGNFAINGFALCNGQVLSIQQYTALFSLMGTFYGGDGVSTFALPDLRGRTIIHSGSGLGLPTYVVGQSGGTPTTTLLTTNMPIHNHLLQTDGTQAPGGHQYPTPSHILGASPTDLMYSDRAPSTNLNPATVGTAGGSQPFSIMNPYLTVTYQIALVGIYPSRN